ncbi:MAG: tyrosine-type recombinase/integrase [Anaerolineae bacterium]|nr:tyrosine-type recombinase/integrase [Anaerolineae bacterium]
MFFDAKAADALRNWLIMRPVSKGDDVFVQKTGERLTSSGIYQIFKKAARDAGVKKSWSPHQWRHAFARFF